MNRTSTRVLALSILALGTMVFAALAASTNASAASVSGTWGSRIPGEGYMQTYIGPYGNVVTDYFDVELQLTESGGVVSGTLRAWNTASDQVFDVWGTVSGSTFYMTANYGWDGVSYLTPVYNLTIEGTLMYGSASYENVGVPITGYFDLEKEGLFGVGGLAPIASGVSIAVAIIAVVIAVSPGKAPVTGYRPGTARASPPGPRYEPSQQWTTEMPPQPMSGDGTVPVGGVGITQGQPYVRPMTDSERNALKSVPKPQRSNAIGISIVSMAMAIMVNFVEEQIALLMPLFFSFVGLGLAAQARKSSGSVAQALSKGTVSDVRGTPRFKGASGWEVGVLSVPKDRQLEGLFVDGVPATVTVVQDAQRVVSVNGVTLKKPAMLRIQAGALDGRIVSAPMQMPVQVAGTGDEDIPPPPDGWAPRYCSGCGRLISDDVMFCEGCGQRLKA